MDADVQIEVLLTEAARLPNMRVVHGRVVWSKGPVGVFRRETTWIEYDDEGDGERYAIVIDSGAKMLAADYRDMFDPVDVTERTGVEAIQAHETLMAGWSAKAQ